MSSTVGVPAAEEAIAPDYSANRLRLSITDVTFLLFSFIPPLVFGSQLLNTDGDAARHIRMGELILANGFYQPDPFSFTEPDHPIMLTEWGSRVVYALAHKVAGLAGVGLLAGLLIGTTMGLVALFLRRRGVDPLLTYLSTLGIGVVSQVHWLARPHLFTFVALALMLPLLEPGRVRKRWWWFALFVAWANLHGGFILGLMLIAVAGAAALAEAMFTATDHERAARLELARWYMWGFALALAATMINPQGPLLHFHIMELFGNETAIRTTAEFQPPNFHEFFGKIFLVVLGLGMTVLALVPRPPRLTRLALILFMMAMALVARRNIPLFGILAGPLLVLHADALWRSIRFRAFQRVRAVCDVGERIAVPGRWASLAVIPLLLLAATRGNVAGVRLIPDSFDPEVFPVEAVEFARQNGVTGRVFNLFWWGGYLIYAWPEQPIFIDGMTDYFSEDLLKDYGTIYRLQSGWVERLDHWEVDLALVPTESAFAYQLRRERDWSVLHEDETAVLLKRSAASEAVRPAF